MANDKMTYNEFFGMIQTSVIERQNMGDKITNEILPQKYIRTGAAAQGMSKEEFISLRKEQLKRMYNVYTEMSRGTYNGYLSPNTIYDTSEEAARRVTGQNGYRNNGVIALDEEDREMVRALVDVAKRMSNTSRYSIDWFNIEKIINNTEALRLIAIERLNVIPSVRDLTEGSTVMEREAHMAQKTYEVPGFEMWTKYQRPGKFEKVLKSISDLINGVKEQDKPFGEQEIK